MDYRKHYLLLIDRARNRTELKNFESHHVVPRCVDRFSIEKVRLTPEEHYVAHQLLVKMYPENRALIFAAQRMTAGNSRNNKLYGWLREKARKAIGENSRKKWKDPKYREIQIAHRIRTWEDPAYRENFSQRTGLQSKIRWRDPAFRAFRSSESRKTINRQWRDPEFQKLRSRAAKAQWLDPVRRAAVSKKLKEKFREPTYRKTIGDIRKKLWQDPQYRETQIAKQNFGRMKSKAWLQAYLRGEPDYIVWNERYMKENAK